MYSFKKKRGAFESVAEALTENAACYKVELERPGGRTCEEVDVEGREKESLLKRVWLESEMFIFVACYCE